MKAVEGSNAWGQRVWFVEGQGWSRYDATAYDEIPPELSRWQAAELDQLPPHVRVWPQED